MNCDSPTPAPASLWLRIRTVFRRRDARYRAHETARMLELEGVPLASFGRRAAAFVLDVLFAGTTCILLAVPVATIYDRLHPGHNTPIVFAPFGTEGGNWYSVLVLCAYITLSLYLSNGWTLAKRLLGIRVVSTVHHRLSFFHSLERALGYAVSAAELGFGFFQYFTAANCRTTHDRIAQTIVVDTRALRREPAALAQSRLKD